MSYRYKNKLNNESMFVKNTITKVNRTTFNRNQKRLTTFNAGDLNPLFVDEVLPGDTYSLDLGSVIRFNSPLVKPVMDDCKMSVYAFFVPTRILEKDWEKLIANFQEQPDWSKDVNLTMSTVEIPTGGFPVGGVADMFGIPVKTGSGEKIIAAPFRAYCLIWNNWFRDENLQKSIFVDTNHIDYVGASTIDTDYLIDAIKGGRMCPMNKIHDYFTSCLPAPQKGAPVIFGVEKEAPVITGALPHAVTGLKEPIQILGAEGQTSWGFGKNLTVDNDSRGATGTSTVGAIPKTGWAPINLYADMSKVTGISVNDLRLSVQIQLIKEADARYGTRYKEYLMGHWGVISADSRLQIPEFLGSAEYGVDIHQTAQTSQSTENSPQSNVSAWSLTNNKSHLFTKSFTEHGYIIVVGGVRVAHRTYAQGLNTMWSRKTRFDFYFPELAHIGEQPVKNKEIYLQDAKQENDGVFGYQEAWAAYRYLPNVVTGLMRPNVQNTLAVWNYADKYTALPTLSPKWIEEDKTNIDRTLSIQSSATPQFIGDFYFKNKATRPMPLHSVPGLLDHSGKSVL